MKTVAYLSRSPWKRRAFDAVGNAVLARTLWLSEEEAYPLVRWTTLSHPSLPSPFDGVRIAQVSDVHAGAFMPWGRLDQVRRLVETLAPDLVVYTGDQLDRRAVDAELFVSGFAGLAAPLGVFGVLGNHDHLASAQLGVAALDAVGATPLVNAAAVLQRDGATLLVAGVDDLDSPEGADFSVLGRFHADFRLLLCHQPRGWVRARRAGADITLAGHTHGGQIAFPSREINLARLSTRFISGPYRHREHLLYVSRGIGVGAVPIRYGSPPEVDLITLRRGPVSSS
ncbi:MAG: metallophosphoesterase [Thermoanaerobaculaceae bacterium]|jgi:predicted MPP superfamily phosphohydrolase|nr:metallophosphoesterase [Thermoanaerobaculaceae bacterium]